MAVSQSNPHHACHRRTLCDEKQQKFRRLGSTGRCLEGVTVKIFMGAEEMPPGEVCGRFLPIFFLLNTERKRKRRYASCGVLR